MGINGLTGFIDRNQHLLHQHQLHDTSVVIDGSNFYYYLYYSCHVNCHFGGDYDIFYKRVVATFESMKMCGITPYIVLDGGYTIDGRKLKTSLSRAVNRIQQIAAMANNEKGQVLPVLACETFMQVLSDLNIRHTTCQFEADSEIAVLANKLKCPVISNDSDFYIFDLTCGFLPLDYIDFRPLHKRDSEGTITMSYLHSHIYNVDDFINSFEGLSRKVLPIFASMLGNDVIEARDFKMFYAHVKVPKIVSKQFHLPPRMNKVVRVLHWLNTCSHDSSTVEKKLFDFVRANKRGKVEQLFFSSVSGYLNVDNFQGCDLFQYLTLNHEGDDLWPVAAAEDFHNFNGSAFPAWFIRSVCRGNINRFILNAAILRRIIIISQVEDVRYPASCTCSVDIRRVVYGILFKDDRPGPTQDWQLPDSDLSQDWSVAPSRQSAERGQPYCDGESWERTSTDHFSSISGRSLEPVDITSTDAHCGGVTGYMKVPSSLCSGNGSQGNLSHTHPGKMSFHPEVNDDVDSCGKGNVSFERVDITADKCLIDDIRDNIPQDGISMQENMQDGIGVERGCDTTLYVKQDNLKLKYVEEFSRLNRGISKSLIDPVFEVGGFSVPSLTELTYLPQGDRECLLFSTFAVDKAFVDKFPLDLQIFMMCIVLWVRNAKPKVTLAHLECVIVSVIFLKALSELDLRRTQIGNVKKVEKGSCSQIVKCVSTVKECDLVPSHSPTHTSCLGNNLTDDFSCDKLYTHCEGCHLEGLRQNLDKYHKQHPSFNRKKHYDPEITHAFAQLQACIEDALSLNKILRCPVPNPRPAELINGTLLYNLTCDLQTRLQPDLFLVCLIGRQSPLLSLFNYVKTSIVDLVRLSSFRSPLPSPGNKRQARKRKGKDKQVVGAGVQQIEQNNDSGSGSEELGVQTVPGFHVANKFSGLCLQDE